MKGKFMPPIENQPNIMASVLDRLVDDDPRVGTPFLDSADLKSPVGLIGKLRAGDDPVSRYIAQQFLPETREALTRFEGTGAVPDALTNGVIDGVNQVIRRGCLYDNQRFVGIKLSRETKQMVDSVVPGANVPFLNRALLDEAYPDDIWKRRRESASYSIRQMKEHVGRDLSALLNARCELLTELSEEYKELKGTILEYGLPDFTAFSLKNVADQKRIRRGVELAIAAFEPRLKSVRVSLDLPKQYDQILRFRIDALLRVDPTPEPVTFDAMLHMTTCEYSVRS
jgi:type VI secretion system protein ImpF